MRDGLARGGPANAESVDFLLDDLEAAREQLAQIRDGRVDPQMLRWCDWPRCLRSFAAFPGPVGDPGWVRDGRTGLLLCPSHDGAGHRLLFDTYPDPDGMSRLPATRGICQCGTTADLGVVSLAGLKDWWRGHTEQIEGV